jgi:hypothetical protein
LAKELCRQIGIAGSSRLAGTRRRAVATAKALLGPTADALTGDCEAPVIERGQDLFVSIGELAAEA